MKHWKGMPAFQQEKQEAYHMITGVCSDGSQQKIKVRFDSEYDFQDFISKIEIPLYKSDKVFYFESVIDLSKKIGQPITEKQNLFVILNLFVEFIQKRDGLVQIRKIGILFILFLRVGIKTA